MMNHRFVTIKVKRQRYSGKPAVAVFIRDTTKKLNTRVLEMQRSEQ